MKILMRLWRRPENGVYYVEIGRGQRKSLKTRDKQEARRLFTAIRREYLAGRLASITGECAKTLADFQTEFLEWQDEAVLSPSTRRANALALRKLIHAAGGTIRLDRLTIKHIDILKAECRGLSPHSINNYLRHCRSVMNKAVEWGYLKTNPFRGAKEIRGHKKQPHAIGQKEVKQLLASIQGQDFLNLVTAYLVTGRRRAELLRLRWQDIRHDSYVVRVKGGDDRAFPLGRAFAALLDSMGRKDLGPVFRQWRPDTVSHKVKKALRDAGLGQHRLHDFRHTFARMILDSGASLVELQAMLGHTEARTTEVYQSLSASPLKATLDAAIAPNLRTVMPGGEE